MKGGQWRVPPTEQETNVWINLKHTLSFGKGPHKQWPLKLPSNESKVRHVGLDLDKTLPFPNDLLCGGEVRQWCFAGCCAGCCPRSAVLCKVLSKTWRRSLAKVLCRVLCRALFRVLCRVLCWVLSTSAVVKFDKVRVRSAAQVAGHSAVQSAAEKSGKGIV